MTDQLANRRRSKRKRFSRTALALGLGEPIVCQVRDISETGARITAAIADLPMSFRLVFSDDGTLYRECYVVWQKGIEFGIRFKERCAV